MNIQEFLAANPDYLKGSVIGNSGMYRRNDESVDDFISRLTAETQAPGFGTAGRPVESLLNAGAVNELAPVDIGGVQYHRVGEDINAPGWLQNFLKGLKPDAAHYANQWDLSQVGRVDPTYGGLMREPEYQESVRLREAAQPHGIMAEDGPVSAFSKTIGTAMGISSLAAAGLGAAAGGAGASTFGSGLADWASGALANAGGAGIPYQSLWSSLAQNAASQGGSFADILSNFGIDPSSLPDMPWGVNERGSNWLEEYMNGDFSNFDFNAPYAGDAAYEASGLSDLSSRGADTALNGTSGSWWDQLLKASPTSALGKLITGNGGIDEILKLGGALGSGVLGYLGSEAQANAANNVSDKYLALGQPYRAKLAESYTPGFDLAKQDPAYAGALDQSANAVTRSLSTKGNPYDSPGALMEAQKYVTQNVGLPQLNTYRSQLGGFGQLGINTAGTADLSNIQNAGGGLNAIGYGLSQLTGNDNTIENMLKKYPGLLGGNMSLNLGKGF
jgi:hypothetical protein